MGALSRTGARIVAAATLAAAAYAGLPAAPATASGCSSADGVTVVVDFHELGGGVQTACVAGGGGQTASQLFPAAGFPLDYVQRQPGFVCRVDEQPADNPCVNTPPTDAYWGLYWSDGKSGRWTYATSSANGQHVPDGGYVAFSWQGSDDSTPPGASPTPHPTATAAPTHASTQGPGHADSPAPPSARATPSGSPGTTASATPTGSAAATTEPGRHERRPSGSPTSAASGSPTTTGSASPSGSPALTAATSDPADPDDGGLPAWIAPAVIVLLFGAAGGATLARRRRGAGRP